MKIVRDNYFKWKNRFITVALLLSRDDNDSHTITVGMGKVKIFETATKERIIAEEIYNLLDTQLSFETASIMMRLFNRIKGIANAREILLEIFSYKHEVYKYRIKELADLGYELSEKANFLGDEIALGYSTIQVSLQSGENPIGEFRGRNNGKPNFQFYFYAK